MNNALQETTTRLRKRKTTSVRTSIQKRQKEEEAREAGKNEIWLV